MTLFYQYMLWSTSSRAGTPLNNAKLISGPFLLRNDISLAYHLLDHSTRAELQESHLLQQAACHARMESEERIPIMKLFPNGYFAHLRGVRQTLHEGPMMEEWIKAFTR
jgi:hypothetical protein